MELDSRFKKFVQKIKKKLKPIHFLLFGSRAKGTAMKYSDYDLILVSKEFQGIKWLKRFSLILEEWDLDVDIHVLPYTPQEFESKKKEGVVVKAAIKESVNV